jgi:hypothetical protein
MTVVEPSVSTLASLRTSTPIFGQAPSAEAQEEAKDQHEFFGYRRHRKADRVKESSARRCITRDSDQKDADR